jgi:hypothetical protein
VSNWLAFATATETLRYVLTQAVAPVGGATVTTGKPTPPPAGDAAPRVNIFLYQVTPNAHWANMDVPTRDARGQLVQKTRAAYDLHYLFTFYGEDATQDDQQLLGLVAQTLHAQPILTRDLVRAAVNANSFLAQSNLADEVELVRVTPARLSLDELAKVWSLFFELHYELSVAYTGSVVFVEADDEVPRAVLPVLDRDIVVTPIRDPAITAIGPTPVIPGSPLVIEGRQLRGQPPATTAVVIDDADVPAGFVSVADDRITVQLAGTLPRPVAGLALTVGPHRVRVEQRVPMGRLRPPTTRTVYESDLGAFVLQSSLGMVIATAPGPGAAALAFAVDPPLTANDKAVLLLIARIDGSTSQFRITSTGGQLQVPVSGLTAGDYLVRVSVNGIESALTRDQNPASPTFGLWNGPQATLT